MKFKISKNNYTINIFYLSVVLELLMIFITNTVAQSMHGFYVYALFLIEGLIILLGIFTLLKGNGLKLEEGLIILLFILTQIFVLLWSSIHYNVVLLDFHKVLLYAGMICACYFVPQRCSCSYDKLDIILDFLIWTGTIACLYNLIINRHYFASKDLSTIMHYTWNFRSFFFTRATYGIYISIASIAALVKSERKNSGWLLFLNIFLVGNVLITAARAEIIAVISGTILYLSYSKKYKKFVIVGIIILLLYLFTINIETLKNNLDNLINTYYIFFNHSQDGKTDITTGRLYLWHLAFQNNNFFTSILGHGIGSKDTLMRTWNITVLDEMLSSFHNGYVDLYFETGILGICFLGTCLLKTFKQVKRYCRKDIAHFFYAILLIWALVNIADSNMLPFTTDMFTPFATFMVITLPLTVANYAKNRKHSI